MYAIHWLLSALLSTAVAHAGSAELEALDRQLGDLHIPVDTELQANPRVLAEAAQALQAIELAAGALPEDQRDAGLLRVAEAYHRFAADLLALPCPAGLDLEQCALFTGLLAEKAQPLATKAATGLRALDDSDDLDRRDRRRLAALAQDLGQLNQALAVALVAMPRAPVPAPRAEPASPEPVPTGWSAPAGRPAQPGRFAIVQGLDALLVEPGGQPILSVGEPYAAGVDQLYVVELLDRQGGFAEVRLGGEVDWDEHCVPHQTLGRWIAVRAWVPEAALVPVVSEDVLVEHADGTGLRLLPGTPVLDEGAWLDGQLVPLPAGGRTALEYGGEAPRLQREHGAQRLPWSTAGSLGGEPFTLRQPAYDHNDALTVTSVIPHGEGSLVTLSERCGELRLLAPAAEPAAELSGVLGGISGWGADTEWVTLRVGALVYWEDGRPAGRVVRDHIVAEAELYGTSMRCVETKLGSAEDLKIPLCFDPADLESP
jgi:hypothetical protein